MAKDTKQLAVGDASDPRTTETDPNGAGTAVGVPHPENRPDGQSLPAVDLSGFELDDYDEDKQRPPLVNQIPPDQDVGESFREIVDIGETPKEHQQRTGNAAAVHPTPAPTPMVDNQTNQPDRFHNREPEVETVSQE
jgi:hypothetical protein